MKISEAWSAYEVDKRLERYSENTLDCYRLQASLLIRAIGDMDVNDVTPFHLKGYLAGLSHLAPSSLSHVIKSLRSIFRWVADEGHIKTNPTAKLKEPRHGPRIPKALTEEELVTLQICCETTYEHALIEFLFATGCRIGEVQRVNIADINWDKRSLMVIGKEVFGRA